MGARSSLLALMLLTGCTPTPCAWGVFIRSTVTCHDKEKAMPSPAAFLADIIDPGLNFLSGIGGPTPSDNARRFLLAIAQQESGPNLDARYQGSPSTSPGPARGWWQFEQGGGVAGVLQHNSSKALAASLCQKLVVQCANAAVWRALEGHDLLAVGIARMLILTTPKALPTTESDGWSQYLDLWRPGKPHQSVWPGNWSRADAAVKASPVTTLV